MSDGVFIPGMSDRYNSQSTIEKIMSKRRERLEVFDKEKEKIEEKRVGLGEINGRVIRLDRLARNMYGVSNPFDDKIGYSFDDNIVVSVTRNADVGEYYMSVKQRSQAHRVASISLNRDRRIAAGNYRINSGEKTANIRFQGGNIDDFRAAINQQGRGIVRASITNDTSRTSVLILQSEVSGTTSRITFEDDRTANLFKELGFFEEVPEFLQEIIPDKNNVIPSGRNDMAEFEENNLKVETGKSFLLNIQNPVSNPKAMVLEIDMRETAKTDADREKEKIPPAGPNFKTVGDAEIMGIDIPGEGIAHGIPPFIRQKPEIPAVNHDSAYIELVTDSRRIEVGELDVEYSMKTLKFNLGDYLRADEQLTGIVFKNNDTEKNVFFGKVKIYDSESADGIRFLKELSKPQNTKIIFDGLEVERPGNTINDLIRGVTFELLGETKGEARIQIDRDYPKMVERLVDFLKEYNQLLDSIHVMTENVADNTPKMPDDPENRGILRNERQLRTLAATLRTIMMNSYETQYGMEFSMLSQLGISTNATNSRSGPEKLRGLLEYDEDKFVDQFIEAMEKYPEGVKELFGRDTDNDFIFDSGIAVEINRQLKAYLDKTTGYFDMRRESYANEYKRKDEEIEKFKEKLDDEESKLRDQFFRMERSAQEMEDNRRRFDDFNRGNRK